MFMIGLPSLYNLGLRGNSGQDTYHTPTPLPTSRALPSAENVAELLTVQIPVVVPTLEALKEASQLPSVPNTLPHTEICCISPHRNPTALHPSHWAPPHSLSATENNGRSEDRHLHHWSEDA